MLDGFARLSFMTNDFSVANRMEESDEVVNGWFDCFASHLP